MTGRNLTTFCPTPKTILALLKMGNSNDLAQLLLPLWATHGPQGLVPRGNSGSSWPSVTGKGDMTGKENESDKKSLPETDIFLQEYPSVNYFSEV